MMTAGLTDRILSQARSAGASTVGVADAGVFEREREALQRSITSGRAGPLHFTYDDPETATDPRRSFGWARHIVVVGYDYLTDAGVPPAGGALVGRFATANHYQNLERITAQVTDTLRREGHRAEVLIDDNRLVDRGAAVRAGLGWSGRSTMVLAPGHGPWMLFGSVVTDADLETTPPMERSCGTCVACFPACPTGALSERGLDARRCLSTWLQSRGSIPHWIRPRLGRRIYGCDECLTACPPGFPRLGKTVEPASAHPFDQLLELSDDELLSRFDWWYVPMRDGRYLRRNVLIAAGNSGESSAVASIRRHVNHPSSSIRGIAAWSLARSAGPDSLEALDDRITKETTAETIDELRLARTMVVDEALHHEILLADETANTSTAVIGLGVIVAEARGLVLTTSEDDLTVPRLSRLSLETMGDEELDLDGADVTIVYDPHRKLEEMRNRGRRSRKSRQI